MNFINFMDGINGLVWGKGLDGAGRVLVMEGQMEL